MTKNDRGTAPMSELAPTLQGDWEIDPGHSRIGFVARHAMVTTVRGAFNDLEGHIHADPELERSRVRVVLKTASVDTRNAQRDEHLRSEDFFNVEKWPDITFVSTHIDEVEESAFAVAGDLTIRDVTQQVILPLQLVGVETDAFGARRAGFSGSRRINRRDFGLEWNLPLDSGGVLVSEKITLEFEISAIKREELLGQEDVAGDQQDGEDGQDRIDP